MNNTDIEKFENKLLKIINDKNLNYMQDKIKLFSDVYFKGMTLDDVAKKYGITTIDVLHAMIDVTNLVNNYYRK